MAREDEFWRFSNRLYRQPGVAETCLDLQNRLGADVNLLLFACWQGAVAGSLDQAVLHRAAAFSRVWAQQVVHPLRSARSWMKKTASPNEKPLLPSVDDQHFESLRTRIKATELDAEHYQQSVLQALAADGTDSGRTLTPEEQEAHIRSNLQRCLALLQPPPAGDDPLLEAALQLLVDRTLQVWQPH